MKNFKYKESPIFRFLLFLYSFELFFFIIVYLYVHITNRTYIPSNYILVMLLPALSALFATNSVFPYNKANTFFTFFTFYFILIFLYTIFSATVIDSKSIKCCWTIPIPCAIESDGLWKFIFFPFINISPESGFSNP